MKRVKPALQPTRIMPKRGKTRQGNSSETTQETLSPVDLSQKACATLTEQVGSSSEHPTTSEISTPSRQKRRRRTSSDHSSNSKTSLPAEASSSTNAPRSNGESPDLSCSICLSAVEDRAFTDACYHIFCFECLVEWSRVRAVCPLCKKSFHSIIHSFKSYDNYELYQVPTSYSSSFANVPNSSTSRPTSISRFARFFSSAFASTPTYNSHAEHMDAYRRRVYSHSDEIQLRGLWSSDGVVVPSPPQVFPAMFDYYPVMLERIRPWVLRDISVIIGNGDVQAVTGIVLDLLRSFAITSEEFYERLFPFLGQHTRRFILELDSFARSPFDMTTYDARVVYTMGTAETPVQLPAEHIEDISSGDDSDIEIVSPALVTYSEASRSSHQDTTSSSAMSDLIHCLRSVQQNMLWSFANHQNLTSGLESPVPGPSGLGQAILAEESDSVGSRTSQSLYDADNRSQSPMILSDADSDVLVVDIDGSVHSPINISSSEEESGAAAVPHTSRHHRFKKRRRKREAEREQGSVHEKTNDVDSNGTVAAVNETTPEGSSLGPVTSSQNHSSFEFVVKQDTKEPVKRDNSPAEHAVADIQTQKPPSTRSSSVELNEHSSSTAKLYSSQPRLRSDVEISVEPCKPVFSTVHPKRSRSANSIKNLPVKSVLRADNAKTVTCKKHVTGHKSSKQKARELAAESSKTEISCEDDYKSLTCSQVGSSDVPLNDDNKQTDSHRRHMQDINTIPSATDHNITCLDLSSNCQVSEEVANAAKPSMCNLLHGARPVPCTSDTYSPAADASVSTAADNCDVACHPSTSSSCDMLPIGNFSSNVDKTYSLHSDELPQNHAAGTSDVANLMDSSDYKAKSICKQADTEGVTCRYSQSPCVMHDHSDDSLQISAIFQSSSYQQLVQSEISSALCQPSNTSPVMPTESSANTEESACKKASTSENLTSQVNQTKDVIGIISDSYRPRSCSSADNDQSVSSPLSGGLAISIDCLHSDINDDSIQLGVDSSDSEVEWLETDAGGRQHCISISSSGSTDIYNELSDTDDIESVVADSDSLEVFDDELPMPSLSQDESQEACLRHEANSDDNSSLSAPVLLARTSDIVSTADLCDSATVVNSNVIRMRDNESGTEAPQHVVDYSMTEQLDSTDITIDTADEHENEEDMHLDMSLINKQDCPQETCSQPPESSVPEELVCIQDLKTNMSS